PGLFGAASRCSRHGPVLLSCVLMIKRMGAKEVMARTLWLITMFLVCQGAKATDWPQYRGPTTDGVSLESMYTRWPTNGSNVVWRNASATNGFSSVAISQGRAFAMSL